MNDRLMRQIFEGGLLLILAGIVLHAPLSVGLGSLFPDYTLAIKAWKELLMLPLAALAIVLAMQNKLWPTIAKSWLVRLSLLFIVLHLGLLFVFNQGLEASVAGLMIDLRFIAFFLLTYLYGLIEPRAAARALKAVAAGMVVVVGFGLLQITVLPDDILTHIGYESDTIAAYTTIDKNPDFVRINSTLRGPNPLGALMVIALALTASWWLKHKRTLTQKQYVYAVLVVAAIVAVLFASYSRSAYIAAIVALATVFLLSLRRTPKPWLYGIGCAFLLALASLFALQQTDWYANVVLHEDPDSSVVKKSNGEHVRSLLEGYSSALTQPLGEGIGSTGSAPLYSGASHPSVIENYYLFVAHESGWLGLGLFLALIILVHIHLWRLRKNWQATALLASGIGLAVIGLLLPVWVDDTVALVWWGLAGVTIAHFSGRRV